MNNLQNGAAAKVVILIVAIVLVIGSVIYVMKPKSAVVQTENNTVTATQEGEEKVQNGSEVNPILRDEIVKAFIKRKEVFARNNLLEIRQYFTATVDGEVKNGVKDMSDSDLQKLAAFFNSVQGPVTVEMLTSSEAIWTINPTQTNVSVYVKLPPGNPNGYKSSTLEYSYEGGQWY